MPSATAGLIGTLLLHVLVVQTVVFGSHAHKVRPPDAEGPGATLIKSATVPVEALVLLELPSVGMKTTALMEELASAASAPKNLLVTVIGSDPLPQVTIPPDLLDDTAEAASPVDSGDPAGRALLFGRYSGQIQARIERAWRRPRSPIGKEAQSFQEHQSGRSDNGVPGEESFRCQVRILQDGHGAVEEVQMLSCNGNVTWQQSLVTAILSASPLPAPPDPTVFSRSLTMTFEAQVFTPGGSTDGYEVERSDVASIVDHVR